MDQFERATDGVDIVAKCRRDQAGSFQAEDGADPLAPCKHAVTHGAMNGGRLGGFGRQQLFQLCVDSLPLLLQVCAKSRSQIGGGHAVSSPPLGKGSAAILPSPFFTKISTLFSASSSCRRQTPESFMPSSNSSSERSRERSPCSSSFTICSSRSRPASNAKGFSCFSAMVFVTGPDELGNLPISACANRRACRRRFLSERSQNFYDSFVTSERRADQNSLRHTPNASRNLLRDPYSLRSRTFTRVR